MLSHHASGLDVVDELDLNLISDSFTCNILGIFYRQEE